MKSIVRFKEGQAKHRTKEVPASMYTRSLYFQISSCFCTCPSEGEKLDSFDVEKQYITSLKERFSVCHVKKD